MNEDNLKEICELFRFASLKYITVPEWGLLLPISDFYVNRPNTKHGIPDVFLPVTRDHYHGLFIKFVSKTDTSESIHKEWLSVLSKQHYKKENHPDQYKELSEKYNGNLYDIADAIEKRIGTINSGYSCKI